MTYFLITEFKDFAPSDVLPNAAKFGARLATTQTYDGSRAQAVG